MVEVMEIMATSFRRSHDALLLSAPSPPAGPMMHCSSVPPALQQATTDPRLHWRLLDTHSKSGPVSCGVTAPFFWFCCAQGSVCALQDSVFQSCVSSGGSMVGLLVTSSQRAYAIPKSAAPRAPALQQAIADPHLCRRPSNTVLSQSLWGLWVLVRTRYV